MSSERIADIKINMDRVTNDELVGMIGHQELRVAAAQGDLDKLLGFAAVRGLLQPDDGQGTLFDYEAQEQ